MTDLRVNLQGERVGDRGVYYFEIGDEHNRPVITSTSFRDKESMRKTLAIIVERLQKDDFEVFDYTDTPPRVLHKSTVVGVSPLDGGVWQVIVNHDFVLQLIAPDCVCSKDDEVIVYANHNVTIGKQKFVVTKKIPSPGFNIYVIEHLDI